MERKVCECNDSQRNKTYIAIIAVVFIGFEHNVYNPHKNNKKFIMFCNLKVSKSSLHAKLVFYYLSYNICLVSFQRVYVTTLANSAKSQRSW